MQIEKKEGCGSNLSREILNTTIALHVCDQVCPNYPPTKSFGGSDGYVFFHAFWASLAV